MTAAHLAGSFKKLGLCDKNEDEIACTDGEQPDAGRHRLHGRGRLRVPDEK
jgi:hypothetical protein